MKKYKINAQMIEYGYFEVEAKSREEAIEFVKQGLEEFISEDSVCEIDESVNN